MAASKRQTSKTSSRNQTRFEHFSVTDEPIALLNPAQQWSYEQLYADLHGRQPSPVYRDETESGDFAMARYTAVSAVADRILSIDRQENALSKSGGTDGRCLSGLPVFAGRNGAACPARQEDYPPYKDGLPQYVRLKNVAVKKKLKGEFKP